MYISGCEKIFLGSIDTPHSLQYRFLDCDHPPLTIPNNHRPRSPYPAGKQTPPAPSSSPLHPPFSLTPG